MVILAGMDDTETTPTGDPVAETKAARAAAAARRQPADPNAPAASPNSGHPGAVPDPDVEHFEQHDHGRF